MWKKVVKLLESKGFCDLHKDQSAFVLFGDNVFLIYNNKRSKTYSLSIMYPHALDYKKIEIVEEKNLLLFFYFLKSFFLKQNI